MKLPQDKICECGKQLDHWEWTEADDLWRMLTQSDNQLMPKRAWIDVVERDCPHSNGTVIEHCPQCDRKVGMWGCGGAGEMECECWD